MDLRLLGPVEAIEDDRRIPLGTTKQRALLALLALRADRTVAMDRLVEGLWGDAPPPSAPKMIQLYVSQLRKLLAGSDAEIITHGRGYELRLASGSVDAEQFERLVAAAASGAGGGTARQALALWRGDVLADLVTEPFAAAEITRLHGLWLLATELAIDADLAAGRHRQVLGELGALVASEPLEERLQAQRMLALYRSGRQAEALDAYQRARRALVGEIGVEPGPELRELHSAILRRDGSLDLAPARTDSPSRGSTASMRVGSPGESPQPDGGAAPAPTVAAPAIQRARGTRVLAFAGVLALVVAFTAFALAGRDARQPDVAVDEDGVAMIDPDEARVAARYRTGHAPGAVAAGAGSVWVANTTDATVSRIVPGRDGGVAIPVGGNPGGLAFAAGALWVVVPTENVVAQVDPVANRVTRTIKVGNNPSAIAAGYGALWVTSDVERTVTRVDLVNATENKVTSLGAGATAVAAGAGAVWVASEEGGAVFRIDPRSGAATRTINVGNGPVGVAVHREAVWVANRQDATVSRIDGATSKVTDTVPVGRDPAAVAAGPGAVWVATSGDAAVTRIDPRTRRKVDTISMSGTPSGMAIVDERVWTTARPSPASHRGGTLRVRADPVDAPTLEPGDYGNATSVQALSLAYDGLVAYRRAGGSSFGRLVGNLATDVPRPSTDGKTYVFELRAGIRYSDGTAVQPQDFRASLENVIRRHTWLPPYYEHIIGARACVARPARCDLSHGITSDARTRTITIRLSRPDSELLDKLAFPFAFVVPAGRPFGRRTPPPGTGPYRIVRFDRKRGLRLTRNAHFKTWSADARPDGYADEVVFQTDAPITAQVAAVERGKADVVVVAAPFGGPLPPQRVRALFRRAAGRLHTAANPELDYMFLNVTVPPFDDARVRRALNYAVDRAAIATLAGGPELARLTCQLLPAGFPGYTPACPYTRRPGPAGGWSAPDLERARRLIERSGTQGMKVTVWGYEKKRGITRAFAALLGRLGYDSSLRVFDDYETYRTAAAAVRNHAQIGIEGWTADVAARSNFTPPFSCVSRAERSSSQGNLTGFCDRRVEALSARALAAQGSAADAVWDEVYRRITVAAPAVPLVNRREVTLVSGRVGNYQHHPLWGTLLDQLWVH